MNVGIDDEDDVVHALARIKLLSAPHTMYKGLHASSLLTPFSS